MTDGRQRTFDTRDQHVVETTRGVSQCGNRVVPIDQPFSEPFGVLIGMSFGQTIDTPRFGFVLQPVARNRPTRAVELRIDFPLGGQPVMKRITVREVALFRATESRWWL